MKMDDKTKASRRARAMMHVISISEITEITGISSATLRRIELGGLPSPGSVEKINDGWKLFCKKELNHG